MNQGFIYLASASPRRAALLKQIGVCFRVHAVDIDEQRLNNESAEDHVLRLAQAKALAAASAVGFESPIVGADTVVVIDNDSLGKPAGREEALLMLSRLSGRAHQVLTSVAVVVGTAVHCVLSTTEVHFRVISSAEQSAYWETGEPADKAGAYAIQGRGAVFVEKIKGSYSAVMGLPLFETARLLQQCGVEILPTTEMPCAKSS